MKDKDIKKLTRILKDKGRQDLAGLLKDARGEIDESSTYGSYLFSTISQYLFYLPLDNFHKAKQLSDEDNKVLLETVLYLYPHQAEAPEITNIDFRLLHEEDDDIVVGFENGEVINYDFVEEQLEKSEQKIQEEDYDGAITSAHSLLQGVLSDIYKRCTGFDLPKSGDIRDDYKKVKSLMNFSEEKLSNDSIIAILRGLNTVVHGIDALGNQLGDRHRRTIKPDKRHAKLAVNSARTVCDFMYDSLIYQEKRISGLYEELIDLLNSEKRLLDRNGLLLDTDIAKHISKYDEFLKSSVKQYFISNFEVSAYRLSDIFFAAINIFFDELNENDLENIYSKHHGNDQACGLNHFLLEVKNERPEIIKSKEIIRHIEAVELIQKQREEKEIEAAEEIKQF